MKDEFSKHLGVNSTLRQLQLSGNFIGACGAEALADALRDENSTLQHLDLSHNSVGANGARAIAEVLRTHSALNALLLSGHSCSFGAVVFQVRQAGQILDGSFSVLALSIFQENTSIKHIQHFGDLEDQFSFS